MASITSLADAASPGAWIASTRAAAAVGVGRSQLAFRGECREHLADPSLGVVGSVDPGIEDQHAMPRLRGHLRDAGAHRAGAEHRHRGIAIQGCHRGRLRAASAR